jgi:hypothetical protein
MVRDMLAAMTFRKLFVLSAFAFACGGSTPTNFAGTYTLTTTENANSCNLANWTQGSTTTFTAKFTQDGTNAQLTVEGAVALFLDLYVGTATFQGTVSGNTFTTEFIGTKSQSEGTCTYTTNIGISATLDNNNVISGTITLTPVTNGDPSCGAKNTCNNTETVSGNRTGP